MKTNEILKLISENELLDKIYQFSYHRCNTSFEAEDLCSDIVLAVISAIHKQERIENLYAFVWTVARRAYADYCEKRSAERRVISIENSDLMLVSKENEIEEIINDISKINDIKFDWLEAEFVNFKKSGNNWSVTVKKEKVPKAPKEKKDKKSVFSWKKKSEKDIAEKEEKIKEETETVKEEIKPVVEDEEVALVETTDETSVIEEKQEEKVEEIQQEPSSKETDEKVEEIPPFEEETVEEKVEETIEELPAFVETKEDVIEEKEEAETPEIVEETPVDEEIKEEVIEVLSPFEEIRVEEKFEELPPFQPVEAEETVESVDITEEKTGDVKPVKQKKVKEKKAKKEKAQQIDDEPLTKKDHITFVLAILALVLAAAFVFFKFFPMNNSGVESPESNIETGAKLSEIQVVRQGTADKYIQSDSANVFYSVSSENEIRYYEYENGAMKPLQVTGTVNAQVSMDKENLPVTIDYVKTGDSVFGISIFRSEDSPGSTLHNVITFKLVDLPEKHKADGKALLLAVANSESTSRRYNLWSGSFIVDLQLGATTRFLTADKNGNSYSVAYSVLTNSAYVTDGDMIPFFTTREYDDGSGKKDLFVKNGANESLFATDVYGEYIHADKDVIAYLKATETGFNVVKKENTKEEKIVFSLYGSFSLDYLYHQEYILNKLNGNLYNVKTGEEIALAGYKMSNAEMMSISPDGRYLVVLGTVNSVADYQVHVFDLKRNDYAKYEELNFSQHYNLSFVDETKAMYVVVDPNGGYEHVVLDVSKGF